MSFFDKISLLFSDAGTPTEVSDTDPLPVTISNTVPAEVSQNGILSTVNSSTAVLASAATFTGTGELNDHPDAMVFVATDQNGTFYLELSTDGTNWDTSLTYQYDTARINPPHIVVKGTRYFRVRFTNDGSSSQTYFRLQTYYGQFNKLTASINGTLSENYDATVVRPTDYKYEVAMSKRQGRSTWNKFGYNPDIDSAAEEIIAAFGGTFTIMTSDDTLDVVSSDANDTSAGTGARTILITGIDENYNSQIEIVTMNGTSSVTTTNNWYGVNRVVVLSSGSNDANVGDITITDTTGSFGTQAAVPAEGSVTQQCIFHTPINHNFLNDFIAVNARKASGGGTPDVLVRLWSYSRVTDTNYEVWRKRMDISNQNNLEYMPSQPTVFGGREVLYMTAETDTNNTEVTATFSGILERVS